MSVTGFNQIQKIRRIENDCDKLGLRFAKSRYFRSSIGDGDVISLMPKDDESLPVYARDAELFTGSLEEIEFWLRGVEWARNYDYLLKLSTEKKRSRREDITRQENLVRLMKQKQEEE